MIIDIFYRIINQKNRKYKYSPIYLRIEKIYDSWYSKNVGIVNNRKASVTKIREKIFELVKELKKDGLKKEDISKYYNIINTPSNQNRWYKIVAGILTIIGGNEIIKSISGDLYKGLLKTNWLKQLSEINWSNNQIISLIISLILLIILTLLFIRLSYILITNDTSKRDNMKKAIFKEVGNLYENDKVNVDNIDLRSSFDIACDDAISPIKFEWTSKLWWAIKKLVKKTTVLRSMALIILILPIIVLISITFCSKMYMSIAWDAISIFVSIILLYLIVDYIHGWRKYTKCKK